MTDSAATPRTPTTPSPAPDGERGGRLPFGQRLLSTLILITEVVVGSISVACLAALSAIVPAPRIHFLMRLASWLMLKAAGIQIVVRGRENLPSTGGYLLVSNHVNMFDPMIMYVMFPQHIVAIEKSSHFRWPFYGAMIRNWGNLPVSASRVETRDSLGKAADLLRAGKVIFVFPEGTRARSGTTGSFKKGAFHLALQARVPLIPVAFKGADKIFLEGTKTFRPGTEEAVFLPPVDLEGYAHEEVGRLAENVRSLILAELDR